MSGVQRAHRPPNAAENSDTTRPALMPAGNKARLLTAPTKPVSKPLKRAERASAAGGKEKMPPSPSAHSPPPLSPSLSDPTMLRRHDVLLHSNLSLNASFSSDCSTDSFRSRASTGRIGSRASLTGKRRQGLPRPDRIISKLERIANDGLAMSPTQHLQGKRRCAWVTSNTDLCYVAFHDEEWGVPVHDDKKLFELLVLSGALAELSWPVILSKRHIFREVFMDFDPVEVSKLNEKKITAQGSIARSLLSELKLRAVIENARLIVKIIAECGSFGRYCWSFVNHKPIVSRFRYPRQVPVKTPKADVISKDLLRRGFRCVGPTVIYSFMQAAGITNDHLISCYRFEECCAPIVELEIANGDEKVISIQNIKREEDSPLSADTTTTTEQEDLSFELDLATEVDDLSLS